MLFRNNTNQKALWTYYASLWVLQDLIISLWIWLQVIARIVDGSKFDEFKALYGDTLVTGMLYNIFFHFYILEYYLFIFLMESVLHALWLLICNFRIFKNIWLPCRNHWQQRSLVFRVCKKGKYHLYIKMTKSCSTLSFTTDTLVSEYSWGMWWGLKCQWIGPSVTAAVWEMILSEVSNTVALR